MRADKPHIVMMLMPRSVLSQRPTRRRPIKFVFQPNEEIAGAQNQIDDVCWRIRKSDRGHWHIHIGRRFRAVRSVEGRAVTPPWMSSKVISRGRPHRVPESAIDPVVCASAIVQQVQSIQTRFISPMKPIALMFGRIAGGTKNNIIPDSVELEGTIRYQFATKPGHADNPTDKFTRMVTDICSVYGCTCSFEFNHENDAVVNDPKMSALTYEVAMEMVGNRMCRTRLDGVRGFAAFGEHVPHHSRSWEQPRAAVKHVSSSKNPVTIDEETLPIGVGSSWNRLLRFFQHTQGMTCVPMAQEVHRRA